MCQKQALKYTILDVQKELEKGTRKLFTYVQGDVLSHERIYIRHGGKKTKKDCACTIVQTCFRACSI